MKPNWSRASTTTASAFPGAVLLLKQCCAAGHVDVEEVDLAVFRDRRARRVDDDVRVVDAIPRRAGLVEPAEAQPEAVAPRERSVLFEARAVERFGLTNRLLRDSRR